MRIYTAFDRPPSVTLTCNDPSRAKQEFKDDADINVIVKRFGLLGKLPTGVRMPTYGDFTAVSNFHDAANAIAQARESFSAMPAEVRARFQNDAGAFVAFCSDPANSAEAEKLGLVEKALRPAPEPVSPPAPGTVVSGDATPRREAPASP